MTTTRLLHLAEIADEAAAWTTNPDWERHLAQAAHLARLLASQPDTDNPLPLSFGDELKALTGCPD